MTDRLGSTEPLLQDLEAASGPEGQAWARSESLQARRAAAAGRLERQAPHQQQGLAGSTPREEWRGGALPPPPPARQR